MGIVPNNHQIIYNNETIIIDCIGSGGTGADGWHIGSGGSGQTSDGTFRLTADPDWDSVNDYTFW